MDLSISTSCAKRVSLLTFTIGRKTNLFLTPSFRPSIGDERHKVRGDMALTKMSGWCTHSEWNFKNKQLLLEAESHYTMKNFCTAAICYDASIKAAREHKFLHEEAMANELAGLFFLDEGQREKSLLYFKQSIVCYRKWGALSVVRRIEAFIEKELLLPQ